MNKGGVHIQSKTGIVAVMSLSAQFMYVCKTWLGTDTNLVPRYSRLWVKEAKPVGTNLKNM